VSPGWSSASSSLSERLCRRFPANVSSDEFAVGGCAYAPVVRSEGDWWAEDAGEGEAGDCGRDGSAGAIGEGVSVSFARTSACLHVPADDAGIGQRRRGAGEGGPFGFMCRPLQVLRGHEAAVSGVGSLPQVKEAVAGRVGSLEDGDGRRSDQRRDDVGGRSVRCSLLISSFGIAARRQKALGGSRLKLAVFVVGVFCGSSLLGCGGWLQLTTESVTLHASTWQGRRQAVSQHEVEDNIAGRVLKEKVALRGQAVSSVLHICTVQGIGTHIMSRVGPLVTWGA
jgi:hypothetical protein